MYEHWSKARGLSFNSVMVLCSIYESRDGCTQKMIGDKWLLPKQTIHSIVKDFERLGYITLSPSPYDKRSRLIRPRR